MSKGIIRSFITYLLGAKASTVDGEGNTPLMMVVMMGDRKVVEALLQYWKQVMINHHNYEGKTGFELVISQEEDLNIVGLLQKYRGIQYAPEDGAQEVTIIE